MYNKIINQVRSGAKFRVDFKKRKLYVNGKSIQLNKEDLGISKYDNLDDWLDRLEELYDDYKYSRPTANSINKQGKSKFKALTVEELVALLGHNALTMIEISRDEAQAALEIFILFSLINGSFKPSELFSKDWFFQGSDKSLVLVNDWF